MYVYVCGVYICVHVCVYVDVYLSVYVYYYYMPSDSEMDLYLIIVCSVIIMPIQFKHGLNFNFLDLC